MTDALDILKGGPRELPAEATGLAPLPRVRYLPEVLANPDLAKAQTAKPVGFGWEPAPHSKHGGWRRRKGHGWERWYPTRDHAAADHKHLSTLAEMTRVKHQDLEDEAERARAAGNREDAQSLRARAQDLRALWEQYHRAADEARRFAQGNGGTQKAEPDDALDLLKAGPGTPKAFRVGSVLYTDGGAYEAPASIPVPGLRTALDGVLRKAQGAEGPPKGYEPIPGSKHGGYRKRNAQGGWDYWYPPSAHPAAVAAERREAEQGGQGAAPAKGAGGKTGGKAGKTGAQGAGAAKDPGAGKGARWLRDRLHAAFSEKGHKVEKFRTGAAPLSHGLRVEGDVEAIHDHLRSEGFEEEPAEESWRKKFRRGDHVVYVTQHRHPSWPGHNLHVEAPGKPRKKRESKPKFRPPLYD